MLKSSLRLLSSPCFGDKQLSLRLIGEAARLKNATVNISRKIHSTTVCQRTEDRQIMLASMPLKDEGTLGEKSVQIDTLVSSTDVFPDELTPFRLHNGIPFKDLPICNIRVSPNNAIITFTDGKGVVQMIRSCGIEGFKNARKGTNIAAQATATSISMSAIKGLQLGGLEIVSITDNTRISWYPPRPRKARRL